MNLAQMESESIAEKLYTFCKINDIDPNADVGKEIISFLQYEKGTMYRETFENAMNSWTSGRMPELRKPKKLTAYFLGRMIESYFEVFRNSTPRYSSDPADVEPNPREIKKHGLMDYAEQQGNSRVSAYGYFVYHRETDKMEMGELIQGYEIYMEARK